MATKTKTKPKTTKTKAKRIVVVRCTGAGVHAGEFVSQRGDVVVLRNAIRLWRWAPAKLSGQLASLSEVAVHGLDRNHPESRIGQRVSEITLIGACEVITASPTAAKSL